MALGAILRMLFWAIGSLCLGQAACAGQTTHKAASTPQTRSVNMPRDNMRLGHVTIKADELIMDEHISFATNSGVILEQSYEVLDDVVNILKRHPEIVAVHVHGYTDGRGSVTRNLKLSQLRAEAVVAFLREKGVGQALEATGHGETSLVCTEDTDICHTKNRRVAFKIELRQP